MGRTLRWIVISLLLSLLFGLVVGTLVRLRLERPVFYLGEASGGASRIDPATVAFSDPVASHGVAVARLRGRDRMREA